VVIFVQQQQQQNNNKTHSTNCKKAVRGLIMVLSVNLKYGLGSMMTHLFVLLLDIFVSLLTSSLLINHNNMLLLRVAWLWSKYISHSS
jgi:hypothetical protein